MEIHEILVMPEGKTLEFKQDLSSIKPIMKTLVAFANTAGGTLIIGRADGGKIIGIEDIFAAEERLANAIADSIHPPLMPEIETISIEGKSLIVIRVAYWKGPFYIKAQGPQAGVYIRLGSTNRVAGPETVSELQRSVSNISFDQLPCPDVDINGLDMGRIKKAFTGKKIEKNKLESLGILVPYAGKLVCSNGGLILFGEDHVRNRYFSNSTVRCARFQGTDKVHFIDQYDCEGTILEAITEVSHFIRRNTRLAAEIDYLYRKDISEYSPIALREILINALVHADYSIQGMHPRIAIYSDRMEIENPGMLPFGYTMDKFALGVSHIRNKVIARVFRELQLMEEWGTGCKRIKEACDTGGYAYPVWEELGTAIRVALTPHNATLDRFRVRESSLSEELTLRQKRILKLMDKQEPQSAKKIHAELNEAISERTVRECLLELREQGHVLLIGKGPSTLWVINNSYN